MSKIDITKIIIAQKALDAAPGPVCRRLGVLPLVLKDDTLQVAIKDIDDIAAIDQLESLTGLRIDPVEAEDVKGLEKALKRFYPDLSGSRMTNTAGALFEQIINRSLQLRASDIHIHPTKEQGLVQMRIDGKMRQDQVISLEDLTELTSVIKIAAQLDISEKRTPLDGNINMMLMGDEVSLRVATIPTLYGEHITLRLLTQDNGDDLQNLANIGLNDVHADMLLRALGEPNGIVLLSGPTGSGKTTTLYAALRHLRQSGNRHLVSIEDPVETPVDGVTQINVDSEGERVTFNKALRSVLRHDPDIIMVGEIRDGETGDIAVKAALTGHLVLSTLHTNNAAGVITRLINLGIAPFLVASTLRLAIAQRLVRRPCQHCNTWSKPTIEECDLFGWNQDDEDINVPRPMGCDFCGNSGFSGRTALYEMIEVDPTIRKMILDNADESDYEEYAYQQRKLPSLQGDGKGKIIDGLTTPKEVEAVI